MVKIVKVQRKSNGIYIKVPASIEHALDCVEYVSCTADEHGVHYSPIKEWNKSNGDTEYPRRLEPTIWQLLYYYSNI